MKNIITLCLLVMILLLNAGSLSAQSKSKAINYSKYINKTVKYFFSDFKQPIKDTTPIRDYGIIHSFILDLGDNRYLYITPKVLKDSSSLKIKFDGDFDLSLFYPYKIKSIVYRKDGRTIKVYGKYNGRLKYND